MAEGEPGSRSGPMDRLKSEAQGLVGALGNRAVASVRDKLSGTTDRLTDYVEGGGGPGLMAAVTGAKSAAEGKSPTRSLLSGGMAGLKEKVAGLFGRGGKGGGSRKLKLINIVESLDVGVPVTVAYNQWTQYSDFPKFTKKVENVDQNKNEENKTNWKAQVFWSHRTWEATVVEQVPDDRIIWRSKGQKGHVDGTVTFHELAPNLTRILLVLEYHPQGLFERTGNLWRAQGRRARLEFKHFRRHIMTEGILHADDLEGWRGTIHDGEVVESHEDAMEREERERSQESDSQQSGNGQVDDDARDRSEESRPRRRSARARTDKDERADEDENADEESEGEDSGNGRAPAARSRAGRSSRSRSSGAKSADGSGGGNGRRQRAGATARRGGNR
jgi:Polyketide cyclase / dehydrase and lipid transport